MTTLSVDMPGRLLAAKVGAAPVSASELAEMLLNFQPAPAGPDPQVTEQVRQAAIVQRQQVRQALAALAAATEQLEQFQEMLHAEAEQAVVTLALEIAGTIIMQEIDAGRYEVDPIVREALGRVPARQDVVIHLNPDDLGQCDIARQASEMPGAGRMRFVADPAVPPAGCVLETAEGTITSDPREHLERIRHELPEAPSA